MLTIIYKINSKCVCFLFHLLLSVYRKNFPFFSFVFQINDEISYTDSAQQRITSFTQYVTHTYDTNTKSIIHSVINNSNEIQLVSLTLS